MNKYIIFLEYKFPETLSATISNYVSKNEACLYIHNKFIYKTNGNDNITYLNLIVIQIFCEIKTLFSKYFPVGATTIQN